MNVQLNRLNVQWIECPFNWIQPIDTQLSANWRQLNSTHWTIEWIGANPFNLLAPIHSIGLSLNWHSIERSIEECSIEVQLNWIEFNWTSMNWMIFCQKRHYWMIYSIDVNWGTIVFIEWKLTSIDVNWHSIEGQNFRLNSIEFNWVPIPKHSIEVQLNSIESKTIQLAVNWIQLNGIIQWNVAVERVYQSK